MTDAPRAPRIPAHPHVALSVCAYCGVGCGMRLEVRDGAVQRVRAIPPIRRTGAGSARRAAPCRRR